MIMEVTYLDNRLSKVFKPLEVAFFRGRPRGSLFLFFYKSVMFIDVFHNTKKVNR